MKNKPCTFCGSSKSTRSPSGEHLLCASCQHIIVVKPGRKMPKRAIGNRRGRSKAWSQTG